MGHAWGRGEAFIGFCLGGPEGKIPLGRPRLGGMITLSWTLGRKGSMARTGFGWLRIGSSDGIL